MIRTLLIDDHPVVRAGYCRLLECAPQIRVVAEAGTGVAGYRRALEGDVDVVVTDISLPGISGLEVVRRLAQRVPEVRTLVFSVHEESLFVDRAFEAGALGYLAKRCVGEQLIDAVIAVSQGRRYLAPELRDDARPATREPKDGGLRRLSSREFEVFRQLVEGRNTHEIARALSLSGKTVANYGTQIRYKLGASSSADLARVAMAAGIIDV